MPWPLPERASWQRTRASGLLGRDLNQSRWKTLSKIGQSETPTATSHGNKLVTPLGSSGKPYPPLGKTPLMRHRLDAQSTLRLRIANPQTGCDCITACACFRVPPTFVFTSPCVHAHEGDGRSSGHSRSILTAKARHGMRESLSRCAHSLIIDRPLAGTGSSCLRPLGLAAIYLAPSCLRRHCVSRARTVI